MNWNVSTERERLIRKVGPDKYRKLLDDYHQSQKVLDINGHVIRQCSTDFGLIFIVGDTGKSFIFLDWAIDFAKKTSKTINEN